MIEASGKTTGSAGIECSQCFLALCIYSKAACRAHDMALIISPSMVSTFVKDFTISQYFQGATMTCLVYDILITLDQELLGETFLGMYPEALSAVVSMPCLLVRLKTSPKKHVSIVYFMNRYSGIFGEIARIVYILMIRVIALYSRAKFLTLVLQMLLVIEAILMLGMMVHINLAEGLTVKAFAKGLAVCGETNNVVGFGIAWWSIPMVYSAILFLLAVYKAIVYWKGNRGFEGSTLIRVLIQDQIVYFLLAITCNFLNVLEFKLRVSNGLLSALLDTLGSPAFLCIFGSRMLLNLKEAAEKDNYSTDQNEFTRETEMSAIRFS
ncbi:hypothetical protein ACEPAI_5539 [Sanghuangporus weigelae]